MDPTKDQGSPFVSAAPLDADRDSEAWAEEIRRTRARMDATLDQLAERLHPREWVHEAQAWVAELQPAQIVGAAQSGAQASARFVQRHPVACGLIAGGVALAALGAGRLQATPDHPHDEREALPMADPYATSHGDWSDPALDLPGDTMPPKGERPRKRHGDPLAPRPVSQSSSRFHTMNQHIAQTYQSGKGRLQHAYAEHPLATLACFGVAGLLIGLALPRGQAESRTLGRYGERLRSGTRQRAEELVERGQRAVHAAMGTAQQTAKDEDLTPKAVGAKLQHVAESSRQAAADELKQPAGSPHD